MSNGKLKGSDLTRAMLNQSDEPIWCAVSDDSDKETMQYLINNDFTDLIVLFDNDSFISTSGVKWLFATPIKIVALTECEVGLCHSGCINRH